MLTRLMLTAASLGPRARWSITHKAADDDPEGGAGSGLSDDAETDERVEETEKQEEEQEAAKTKGEGDEDEKPLSDEDQTYKKRFSDTKADRDRLKQERDDLAAENAALKRQTQASQRDTSKEPEEVVLAEKATAAAEDEYFKLPKEQQTNRTYATLLTKHTLKVARETATKASQQTVQAVRIEEQERKEAEHDARGALKEIGLEGDVYYDLLVHEAKKQGVKDATWFDRTPVGEQYSELAGRVKQVVQTIRTQKEQTDKEKAEHRREAGGIMPAGSRSASKVKAGTSEEDKEGEDTMISEMTRDRRTLQKRGQQFAAMAHQRP